MFKNKSYNRNTDVIVPKHIEKHDIKNVVKPDVSRNNSYENIRNKVENNQQEIISKPEQKHLNNELNIV